LHDAHSDLSVDSDGSTGKGKGKAKKSKKKEKVYTVKLGWFIAKVGTVFCQIRCGIDHKKEDRLFQYDLNCLTVNATTGDVTLLDAPQDLPEVDLQAEPRLAFSADTIEFPGWDQLKYKWEKSEYTQEKKDANLAALKQHPGFPALVTSWAKMIVLALQDLDLSKSSEKCKQDFIIKVNGTKLGQKKAYDYRESFVPRIFAQH
jgi:hypothetical protein